MSARAERENPIRYLSVDEMMLKIAQMRAVQLARKTPLVPAPPAPREAVEPSPALEFPDYVSHCEAWCAGGTGAEPDERAEAAEVNIRRSSAAAWQSSLRVVPMPALLKRRPEPPAAAKTGVERYVFAAMSAGIAALMLIAAALQLHTGPPAMQMMASAHRNLVAGADPWTEFSTDDIISQVAVPEAPPRRVRHKIAPDKLERDIRQRLASNGFPDIGVSASHHGEVYLAGAVFSMDEAASIVKVARLAAHCGKVFFLHPEVREAQGPTFFGATAEYAPEVWGARVRNVVIGSPAYKAGIRAGDVIREFDRATIADARELEKAVADHSPGQRVTVRSWRDGANRYSIARLTGLTQFASR